MAVYLQSTPPVNFFRGLPANNAIPSPYKFQPGRKDVPKQRWGVRSDVPGYHPDNDRITNLHVVRAMSLYYDEYLQAIMEPKKYVELTANATVQTWMVAPNMLSMATARGSHVLLNKLPRPTATMKGKVDQAHNHTDGGDRDQVRQEEYEDEMRKYSLALHRYARA